MTSTSSGGSGGSSTLGGKSGDLAEFLAAAELQQYHASFLKDLKVTSVLQLKYCEDADLVDIGMSKPEIRRLRQLFKKHHQHGALGKIKKAFSKGAGDTSPPVQEHHGGLSLKSSSPNKHIIPEEALTLQKVLGRGEFGVVQQGVWTNDHGEQIQVAVKSLAKDKVQTQTGDFLMEATNMHSIDHPHIVQLYGVVLGGDTFRMVTELAPLRSLLECLKEPALRGNFTVVLLCDLASQIADGMAYLETRRLIHRDLAARNVLMFTKDKVKISDFGLSRVLGVGKDYYQTEMKSGLKLPIAWCAPECINFLKFTSASDVWSYGVTLWEMFCYGAQPWAGKNSVQIVEAVDEPRSERLTQPEHCPDDWYSLITRCWLHEPSSRPSFADIVDCLPSIRPCRVTTSREIIKDEPGYLRFKAGEFITVLSKIPREAPRPGLWKGVLEHGGHVGFFDSNNTAPFLEVSASAPILRKIKLNRAESARMSIRSSKRLDASMISNPHNDLRHIGHVGYDGAVFGDVAFIGDNYSKLPIKLGNTKNPDLEMRSSCMSLPVNGQTSPASSRQIGSSTTLCSDNTVFNDDEDDFADFKLPDLSLGLDMGGSLMDEVMKALTTVSTEQAQTLLDEYSRAPDVTLPPPGERNGKHSPSTQDDGKYTSTQDDDDESDTSTAGPGSDPDEQDGAVDDDDDDDDDDESFVDSSSGSSCGMLGDDRLSAGAGRGNGTSYMNCSANNQNRSSNSADTFKMSAAPSTTSKDSYRFENTESNIHDNRRLDDKATRPIISTRNGHDAFQNKNDNRNSDAAKGLDKLLQDESKISHKSDRNSDESSSVIGSSVNTADERTSTIGSSTQVTNGTQRTRSSVNMNIRAPQGIPTARAKPFINPGGTTVQSSPSEVDTNPLRRLRDSQAPIVAARQPRVIGSSEEKSCGLSTARNLNVNMSFFDKLKEQEQENI